MRRPAKVVKIVRKGALKIDVRRFADKRYGFDYKPPLGERVKVRCRAQQDAEERARTMLANAMAGNPDMSAFNPALVAEFLRWKQARQPVVSVPDMVARFFRVKETKGRAQETLDGLHSTLDHFAEAFTGSIANLTREEIEEWLNSRGVGPRRWNNMRADIVSLIRFARKEGSIPAELHSAEHIEKKKVSYAIGTYSPALLAKMLRTCEKRDRVKLVLCGLCGVRPEEARPHTGSKKPALRWEHFNWDKRVIDMPPEVSKVGWRRHIPLCDAAMGFLYDERGEGDCIEIRGAKEFTLRVAAASGVPWIDDGLRHSYASYRLPLINNIQQLADEMGNSVKMIRRHYLDRKHLDEAQLWFSVRPDNLEHFGTLEAVNGPKPAPANVGG